MCRPVTSIYECGHIKNAWESCGGDDPAAEPERELMSQTGGCEMCSPSHTPTATIHGWDMCVLQVIVAANHSWRCCECARTNGPNSPSCKREYMFHPFGALLSYADRVCGHPICDDCLGIESNGDTYRVEKPIDNEEEDDTMDMDMDNEEASEDRNDEVGAEAIVEEAVEEEGDDQAAGSQAVAGRQFSLAFRPRVPPLD